MLNATAVRSPLPAGDVINSSLSSCPPGGLAEGGGLGGGGGGQGTFHPPCHILHNHVYGASPKRDFRHSAFSSKFQHFSPKTFGEVWWIFKPLVRMASSRISDFCAQHENDLRLGALRSACDAKVTRGRPGPWNSPGGPWVMERGRPRPVDQPRLCPG